MVGVSDVEIEVLKKSIKSVKRFCEVQKKDIMNSKLEAEGSTTELKWIPVGKVGVYAPAGKAPLPSSVIMAAIPAQVAGVREIIVCSPPQRDGRVDKGIITAAQRCGISKN